MKQTIATILHHVVHQKLHFVKCNDKCLWSNIKVCENTDFRSVCLGFKWQGMHITRDYNALLNYSVLCMCIIS